MQTAIQSYIARTLQIFPDIEQIWLLPVSDHDTHLAIVSDRFGGLEYLATVERLYGLLWTMERPLPSVMLHVLDVDEWQGWRGEDVRKRGKLVYVAQ